MRKGNTIEINKLLTRKALDIVNVLHLNVFHSTHISRINEMEYLIIICKRLRLPNIIFSCYKNMTEFLQQVVQKEIYYFLI